MSAVELKPLERFALRYIRNGGGIVGWYQLALVLPFWIHDFPHEDGNSVRILKRLQEAGLIAPTNPQEVGSKWKYAVTEAGCEALASLGL
jgi:hypothetical protein